MKNWLPVSQIETNSRLPRFCKTSLNSLALHLLLVHSVFDFIISNRKHHWAGRSVNTQTNHIFPIVLQSGLRDAVAAETVRAMAVYLRRAHFIHSLLLTHFLKQAPGRVETEVGESLTWATTRDQEATPDAWETPLSLCSSVLPLPFAYRDSHPCTSLCRLFDDLRSETCEPVWHIYAKKYGFPQNRRAVFSQSSLTWRKYHLWIYYMHWKCVLLVNKTPTVY